MKIKELHRDIERYLLHDCYCPHEIYSFDGFGYQLFYEDQECEYLGNNGVWYGCIARPFNDEKYKYQIVMFRIEDEKCIDAIRYDATENNLKITKDIIKNGVNGRKFDFDEYTPGEMAKTISQILAISDAILID